jgi:hypothetical protein
VPLDLSTPDPIEDPRYNDPGFPSIQKTVADAGIVDSIRSRFLGSLWSRSGSTQTPAKIQSPGAPTLLGASPLTHRPQSETSPGAPTLLGASPLTARPPSETPPVVPSPGRPSLLNPNTGGWQEASTPQPLINPGPGGARSGNIPWTPPAPPPRRGWLTDSVPPAAFPKDALGNTQPQPKEPPPASPGAAATAAISSLQRAQGSAATPPQGPLQPYAKAGDNVELARRSLPAAQALEAALVKNVPGITTAQSPYRLKSKERIKAKAREEIAQGKEMGAPPLDINDAVNRMGDLAGIRVGINNIADLKRAETVFDQNGYDIVEREDKINDPAATGYRALHYKLRDRNTGAVIEAQLVPREVEKVQEKNHDLYKEARATLRAGETPDAAEQRALAEARKGFEPAWALDRARGFLQPDNNEPAGEPAMDHIVGGNRSADVTFASDRQAALYHLGKNLAFNDKEGLGDLNDAALRNFKAQYPQHAGQLNPVQLVQTAKSTFASVKRQVAEGNGTPNDPTGPMAFSAAQPSSSTESGLATPEPGQLREPLDAEYDKPRAPAAEGAAANNAANRAEDPGPPKPKENTASKETSKHEAGNTVAPAEAPQDSSPGVDRIVRVAESKVGNSDYLQSGTKGNFGPGAPKCNQWAYDILTEAGFDVPLINGIKNSYPPLARDWANPRTSIGDWKVVVGSPAQPGDVISDGIHVGIVTRSSGIDRTVSAPDVKPVLRNDWGFRNGQRVAIRRHNPPANLVARPRRIMLGRGVVDSWPNVKVDAHTGMN